MTVRLVSSDGIYHFAYHDTTDRDSALPTSRHYSGPTRSIATPSCFDPRDQRRFTTSTPLRFNRVISVLPAPTATWPAPFQMQQATSHFAAQSHLAPALARSSGPLEWPRNVAKAIGITLIFIGITAVACNTTWIYVHSDNQTPMLFFFSYVLSTLRFGVCAGGLAFVAGVLLTVTGFKPSPCIIIAVLVISVISAMLDSVFVVSGSLAIAVSQQHSRIGIGAVGLSLVCSCLHLAACCLSSCSLGSRRNVYPSYSLDSDRWNQRRAKDVGTTLIIIAGISVVWGSVDLFHADRSLYDTLHLDLFPIALVLGEGQVLATGVLITVSGFRPSHRLIIAVTVMSIVATVFDIGVITVVIETMKSTTAVCHIIMNLITLGLLLTMSIIGSIVVCFRTTVAPRVAYIHQSTTVSQGGGDTALALLQEQESSLLFKEFPVNVAYAPQDSLPTDSLLYSP